MKGIILILIIYIIYSIFKGKKSNPEIKKEFTKKDIDKTTIHKTSNNFVEKSKIVPIIFFDTETNGLSKNNSVLSIAAIKGELDLENKKFIKKDIFQRYYFSKEQYNNIAIGINNLSKNNVEKLRKKTNANYPKYFDEDSDAFNSFSKDVNHFVAHNIKFDSQFIKRNLNTQFCTMLTNTSIVKAKRFKNGKYKWPKLEEAASYYNIPISHDKLHDSLYDVQLTINVFEKMLVHHKGNEYIKDFLFKNKNYLIEI